MTKLLYLRNKGVKQLGTNHPCYSCTSLFCLFLGFPLLARLLSVANLAGWMMAILCRIARTYRVILTQ